MLKGESTEIFSWSSYVRKDYFFIIMDFSYLSSIASYPIFLYRE